MPPVDEIHERSVVGLADGNPDAADVDLIVLYACNRGLGDNIGVMDADELVGRQQVFER